MSAHDGEVNTPQPEQQISARITLSTAGLPDDLSVPDIYSDGANLQVHLSGVNIIFTRSMKDPPMPMPVAVIRLSAVQALILTQTLRKVLTIYQQQVGPITVPDAILDALDIGREV